MHTPAIHDTSRTMPGPSRSSDDRTARGNTPTPVGSVLRTAAALPGTLGSRPPRHNSPNEKGTRRRNTTGSAQVMGPRSPNRFHMPDKRRGTRAAEDNFDIEEARDKQLECVTDILNRAEELHRAVRVRGQTIQRMVTTLDKTYLGKRLDMRLPASKLEDSYWRIHDAIVGYRW